MPKLIYNPGTAEEQDIELGSDPIALGTSQESDIQIEGEGLAPQQARFVPRKGRWFIEDLGKNGATVVDGSAVTNHELVNGQTISLGEYIFQFAGETPAEEESSSASQSSSSSSSGGGGGGTAVAEAPVTAVNAPVAKTSDEEMALVEQMSECMESIRREVAKVIVGQREVLQEILMSMVAGGHALLVGMPGMAKTTMVSTIAKVLDMEFKRIQFTPDLMPTDISGTEILETNRETGDREFRFIKGPIFTNLLLADEINRTPPKTQAALLEAMQEHCVTVGNTTYKLPKPFFVLATQNPVEQEGTYPLPEAQLDRFMFCIWLDYPEEDDEEQILSATTVTRKVTPEKVLDQNMLIRLQEVVRKIPVSDHVVKYTARLVRATRPSNPKAPAFVKEYLSNGAGPRAGQFLILAAKARAVLEGRIHVSCKDIKLAALPVLRHRIYTNFAADSEGLTPVELVKRLVEEVEEPSEKDYK